VEAPPLALGLTDGVGLEAAGLSELADPGAELDECNPIDVNMRFEP
jgi:hypothetical protein